MCNLYHETEVTLLRQVHISLLRTSSLNAQAVCYSYLCYFAKAIVEAKKRWIFLRRHLNRFKWKFRWKNGKNFWLALPGTVKPRLTITPLIWPPRYYSHFILAQTKAHSVIFLFKQRFWYDQPVNTTRFLWSFGDPTNGVPRYVVFEKSYPWVTQSSHNLCKTKTL